MTAVCVISRQSRVLVGGRSLSINHTAILAPQVLGREVYIDSDIEEATIILLIAPFGCFARFGFQ